MKPQTGLQIETPIWNTTKRGASISSGSITLNILNEGNNVWSLIIRMNKTATHTYFNSENLEEAKIVALSKLKKIADEINRDVALLLWT
jgi:hypothetical protein